MIDAPIVEYVDDENILPAYVRWHIDRPRFIKVVRVERLKEIIEKLQMDIWKNSIYVGCSKQWAERMFQHRNEIKRLVEKRFAFCFEDEKKGIRK